MDSTKRFVVLSSRNTGEIACSALLSVFYSLWFLSSYILSAKMMFKVVPFEEKSFLNFRNIKKASAVYNVIGI